ncbi:hypothetical protein F5B22DRAFT_418286 [Xylaria bambusicola]|uniref:uncharacterized protein n=1 Tax=Xylaria bambusicola TaxID=326684 RepID=UPI00200757A4|nr:uncharacterized protein F5B22DRAFT_418286 [Xylaria bambusicola]KAI0523819.1 hypothetical protein F5B22DRAFT_418286 [Xylaria bambusicola]
MAHGFEKLEQFFTGSRRRGQKRQRSTQQQQNASILADHRPSPPMFPSPSYLRPTSIHMTPREAVIDGPECDINRSQSVPTIQEALVKWSSVASSITIVNRPSQSDPPSSPLRPNSKRSPTKPRSSRFRFPEDSLFRNKRSIGSPDDRDRINTSREQSPHSRTVETGLLDWTPTHISLLFNPLEFKASSNPHQPEPENNTIGPSLLPSPDFAPSMILPDNGNSIDNISLQAVPSCSVQKLTSNLQQRSSQFYERATAECIPVFDVDKFSRKPVIHRSMSLNSLAPRRPRTAGAALTNVSLSENVGNSKSRHSSRETWGSKLVDRPFRSSLASNSEYVPRSKLRRSASTSTLSISASKPSKHGVLKEPTFDDFFALSDDDIAENQPLTLDVHTPPTSLRKDVRNSYRKSRVSKNPSPRHITFKPVQEEITPPTTPTRCNLLALTYSPTNPRDTLGALRAAALAKKYDFAVLYVLSLWPVDGDSRLDIMGTTITSGPKTVDMTTKDRLAASAKVTNVSGRLLAAYGLNEVPSPFEIVTDTHLAALNCDYWNEYRNVDARPDDISRGWIRPFYSEYAPVSSSPKARGGLPADHPKNRGIVFAAYSKQTFNPVIPMRTSAKQALLLQQLYRDAKALVETLIEPPSELRKSPTSRQGARNSVAKV